MADPKKQTLKKVVRRIRPYFPEVLASSLLTFVSVALTLYVPILIGRAIDLIVSSGQVDFDGIFRILLRISLCIAGTGLSQWLMNILNNRVTFHIVKNMRNDLFFHIQRLPVKSIDSRPSGDIVSRIIADIDTFSDGLLMGFTQLLSGVVTLIGTLIFMFCINWQIAAIVVCVTPVSFLVAGFIAKNTHSMFRLQSETRGEQTSLIDEAIGELKTVKAFGREEKMLSDFDEINERLRKCSLKAIFFSATTNPTTRFINSVVYAGVILAGTFAVLSGGLTVGVLSGFLNYVNQYTKPFNEISGVLTELQNAVACAERVFDLMDEPAQPPDPSSFHLPAFTGAVRMENVSFSYTENRDLIRDFNLSVEPGQKIAIVGPTGCGKTTMINLLMRFYEINDGKIFLDGVSTRKIPRKELRSLFGMVLQETWLKAGTIRENIAFGKPDATEEEIIAAARAAHAHGFIRLLPKGYDTEIGEAGGALSQGQKQLLCIARVMLCLPPMLILDEATSSIDTRTEMKIQNAFDVMMEGRTSFIVAHRLSTVQKADRILVMKDGRVIEQGNHRELLEKGGFYAELYQSQFARA